MSCRGAKSNILPRTLAKVGVQTEYHQQSSTYMSAESDASMEDLNPELRWLLSISSSSSSWCRNRWGVRCSGTGPDVLRTKQ